jgi:hypothetical protein
MKNEELKSLARHKGVISMEDKGSALERLALLVIEKGHIGEGE